MIAKKAGRHFAPARFARDARHQPRNWFGPFRMHRRIVSRLTDCRRFLIGDAAHLSSAFGGEGLNAGLHDAFDPKVQATARWDEHTAALE
jgi:2-polyprenyl-6-methoxyphenol hydroxylase-like FAD-dependent oxidoreductase